MVPRGHRATMPCPAFRRPSTAASRREGRSSRHDAGEHVAESGTQRHSALGERHQSYRGDSHELQAHVDVEDVAESSNAFSDVQSISQSVQNRPCPGPSSLSVGRMYQVA